VTTMEQSELFGPSIERRQTLFSEKPVLVFWETTRACKLSCVHCRASAIRDPLPGQLTTEEGKVLIEQVASFGRPGPTMIFTGGDPLLRDDLFDLLEYATKLGVRFAVSPAASDLLTYDALKRLKVAGAAAISLSLDGACEETHDSIRREPGTFRRTVQAARDAASLGLSAQVNTTVMKNNYLELPQIFRLITGLGVKTWEVFFLVKVGRGTGVDDLSPEECESVCNLLYDASRQGTTVRTVEAPFVRRVALQRSRSADYWTDPMYQTLKADLLESAGGDTGRSTLNPRGTLDGDGIVFVGFDGSISPGGLLPLRLGDIREQSLREVYRENQLLRQVRERELTGRCGVCEFKHICGGSRARAYARNGDALSSDPSCLMVHRELMSSSALRRPIEE
jgi:AdoMet-dependent heme synthase